MMVLNGDGFRVGLGLFLLFGWFEGLIIIIFILMKFGLSVLFINFWVAEFLECY